MELKRWVVWKYEPSPTGKLTKIPYQPRDPLRKAKSTKPGTWGDYATACAAVDAQEAEGIGFCLLDSGLAAFDIDDCRDKDTGKIHPWAVEFVRRCASYAEVTISGTGLRII